MSDTFLSFLYIFKIDDLTSRKKGISFVEKLTLTSNLTRSRIVVLAGGGDGTVNWLL